MKEVFAFVALLRPGRVLLLIGSALGVLAAIILQNLGILPLDVVSFSFFSFVLFLLALYRLGWVFLLFIAALPLEVINLAPADFGGVMVRPYQWIAAVLLLAVMSRFMVGRLPFRLFRPRLFDALPLIIALGAFLALLATPVFSVALKQAVVLSSFVALYFLGRIFFRTLFDVRQALPFFLVSSLIVCGYAVWQNVRQLSGAVSFQVMAGRPNATFSEADWLGFFVLVVLGVGLTLLAQTLFPVLSAAKQKIVCVTRFLLTFLFLALVFVVLIITVARSAWLGALVMVSICMGGMLLSAGKGWLRVSLPRRSAFIGVVVLAFLLAVASIFVFHLSSFQFLNRLESTGSGLQRITVSCESADTALPQKLSTMAELAWNHCYQIRLEEIEQERQSGNFIQEVYRDDPNVSIRRQVYHDVWNVIQEHPFIGIGWGTVATFLGNDERGAGLNASNVFFEVWLGSGFLGLGSFILLWVLIAFTSAVWFWEAPSEGERLFALFLFATLSGITLFDLFNSGILLGFFFVFLSLSALAIERWETRFFQKKDTL